MRIFITGGSGFVGGHLIEGLRAEHEVLALARSDRSARTVEALGARPMTGELGRIDPAGIEGCDAVVHCAAFVEEWGTRDQFWTANVEGTTQALAAARAAGVGRFIHIGTEAALFDGGDLVDIDEAQPYPAVQRYLYSETKAEAERRVLAAAQEGFAALSVRPRLVWGPRDTSVLPAVVHRAREGAWVWLDGGRHETSTTHVANLVHGVRLALTRGRGGEAYFVADAERSTLRDFLTRLTATQDVTLGDRTLPSGLARVAAAAVELTWRGLSLSGTPPMTRFATAMMGATITVRTDKAARELGYTPVITVEDGLASMPALA